MPYIAQCMSPHVTLVVMPGTTILPPPEYPATACRKIAPMPMMWSAHCAALLA
jgi:hypothetical protein